MRRRSQECCTRSIALDGLVLELEDAPFGGAGYDAHGDPLPRPRSAREASDAVLCGAVGDPQYDALPRAAPRAGDPAHRKELGLFANLRPAVLYPELVGASSLKPEVVSGLDILILRELTGDIYFGEPRGAARTRAASAKATTRCSIRRPRSGASRSRLRAALKRSRKLCSVDKENVLETSRLWREIVTTRRRKYPQVALSHMYVDNAAMQLVRNPKQFDVIVTGNMFGDILSDEASMLTARSACCLRRRSMRAGKDCTSRSRSAPDIAGSNMANPLATILSSAMMLRYTFNVDEWAYRIEAAVRKVLQQGCGPPISHEAAPAGRDGRDGRRGGRRAAENCSASGHYCADW